MHNCVVLEKVWSRLTCLCFHFFLFVLALVTCCQTTSRAALVAYWNFDETTGTNVFDTAGNTTKTNNGFFGGAVATFPNRIAGRLGSGISFAWNGTPGANGGQLITVPYHTNLTMNGPITI